MSGFSLALNTILQLESAWMELARFLGLRFHESLILDQRALFIKRFDRECIDSDQPFVARFAQESLYSLCQRSRFGERLSHNEVCKKLAAACTDPLQEIIEYLKRDIASVALGNTDSHARNTAIQLRENGWVGLTPLFDFAPMALHPDGIARTTRWNFDDSGIPIGLDTATITKALCVVAEPLWQLPKEMKRLAVDDVIIERFSERCEDISNQLGALNNG